jgi:formylglycine-generating enzyme required for sulfatase activity
MRSGLSGLCFALGLALLTAVFAGCPTEPGGDDGTVYTVTIDPAITGADITAEPPSGKEGTEITLTIVPRGGNKLVPGSLKYAYGGEEQLINTSTKKFKLPAADVTIYAEFTADYTVTIDPSLEGIVSASPAHGTEGTLITLTLLDLSVRLKPETFGYDAGNGLVVLSPGSLTFNLPAANVTVKGEYDTSEDLIRRMIRVNGGTVSVNTGAYVVDTNWNQLIPLPFMNAGITPVAVQPFSIGAVEVSYRLWWTVKTWATAEERGDEKYTFTAEQGREGELYPYNYDNPPMSEEDYPVVNLSWVSAVVWCNAYSEWMREAEGYTGFEAVYYKTSAHEVLRSADVGVNTNTPTDVAASIWADIAPDPAKHGYRLPTYAEWEFAARGGDPSAPAWSYPYAGSPALGDVAWHGSNAGNIPHPVGKKLPNTLGLYDMTGNAEEYIQELRDSSYSPLLTMIDMSTAVGGDYYTAEAESGICARTSTWTYNPSKTFGFRVAGPASIGVSP